MAHMDGVVAVCTGEPTVPNDRLAQRICQTMPKINAFHLQLQGLHAIVCILFGVMIDMTKVNDCKMSTVIWSSIAFLLVGIVLGISVNTMWQSNSHPLTFNLE